MSQELLYTSAPRGLWPGSQGYCTVACTARMPRALAERLEGLSAYRHIFPPHDPRAALNPVAFSHMRVTVGGTPVHVLSRVGFAGLDYTDRTNKFAHHVALDPSELPGGGPAWLLGQPGFLRETWDGQVGFLADGRAVPTGDVRLKVCRAWQAATGDAGWAGVLAEACLADPKKPVYLVFEPGQDLLPLVAEALALLPPERRWEVTFSTYFTNLPQGVACAWRGVVRDSPEAVTASRTPQALVLDLSPSLGLAPPGPRIEQARTGRPAVPIPPTASTPPPLTPGHFAPQPGKPRPRRAADVPTAEVFDVVPTLSPSSAAPPPLPPGVNQTPSRRGRRTALIVGSCGFLLVLGGLVASQLSRSANKGRPSKATVALNEVRSPRKELVVSLPPPDPPREDAPPGPKEEAAARETEGAKENAPDHKTAEPVKSPDTPRFKYIHSSCELPPPFGFLEEQKECDLLTSPLAPGSYEITLLGLKDPEFEKVLDSRKEDNALTILTRSPRTELARITIRDDRPHLSWNNELRANDKWNAEPINAMKSCVLSVAPAAGTLKNNIVHLIALRKPIDLSSVNLNLSQGQIGHERAIPLPREQLPFGRPLVIKVSRFSNNDKIMLTEKGANDGTRRRLKIQGYDHLTLNLRLLDANSSKSKSPCATIYDYEPGKAVIMQSIAKECEGITAETSKLYRKGHRNVNDGIAGIRDGLSQLENQSRSESIEIEGIRNELDGLRDRLNNIKKAIIKSKADNQDEIFDQLLKSLIKFGRSRKTLEWDFASLKQLHDLRNDPAIRDARLGMTLSINVEGESVEIAHVGALPEDRRAEPVNGADQ